ncbi:MAG: hypothetical protein IPM54_40150 [Polyangiaceae bacterium]|nr:hypothetical protein [Polyangiaceae bacterium]
MGKPKFTVTNDGIFTSVSVTMETELPPMIFVGINEALAEVPPNATWLSKTDYKFEHVIDAEEMKTAQFIEEVLSWISLRLQTCDWQRMSSPDGPCHGALTEAWKSQESIIMDWSEDPMGLDEQWAQVYSELFAGITYDGLAAYSMGDGFGDAWEEYIYSRLQTEYLEHAKVTKQVVVDIKTNKFKTVTTGRSVISWEDPRQRVIVDEAEDKARVWKMNDDPASPMVAACQHLATLGLVTRGFRIELAKNELQPSIDMMGLSAAPAFGSPVFGSPGKWLWRGDNDVTNVAKMCAESPPLAPGSVYTYHSHHQLAFTEVIVGKALVKDGADPSASLRARIEAATGKVSSKVPDAIKGIEKKDQADFDALPDKTGYSIQPVTVKWQGQGKGSHIFHVLRVHKDKTRVQLFDAGGGGNSREPMENEKDVNGRSLGRGLVLESGLGSNMDTCAYTKIYSNDAGPPNGVGISKPAPDLQKQIDLMKKARPIGLARLVLTERTSSRRSSRRSMSFS